MSAPESQAVAVESTAEVRRCPFHPAAQAPASASVSAPDAITGGNAVLAPAPPTAEERPVVAASAEDWRRLDDGQAAAQDPLGMDGWLATLPARNADKDVCGLARGLSERLPSRDAIRTFSVPEALAAMRDVGMVLSSLQRHGAPPVAAVPRLEAALGALALRTDMVPRDTVYHYCCWNPRGERQRMFTGDAQETALIECVRRSVPLLRRAVRDLVELLEVPVSTRSFGVLCAQATEHLRGMVDVIDYAKQNVSPVYFAQQLRPYFEPVTVAGHSYLGPAAAHIPLWMVDHLLWGSDCEDPLFQRFRTEAALHTAPDWRALYDATREGASLLTRVRITRAATPAGGETLRANLEHFVGLLKVLLTFRGKHRVLAIQAYDPAIALYAEGSGGHPIETLDRFLQLTLTQANLLRLWAEARGHGQATGTAGARSDPASPPPGCPMHR